MLTGRKGRAIQELLYRLTASSPVQSNDFSALRPQLLGIARPTDKNLGTEPM